MFVLVSEADSDDISEQLLIGYGDTAQRTGVVSNRCLESVDAVERLDLVDEVERLRAENAELRLAVCLSFITIVIASLQLFCEQTITKNK